MILNSGKITQLSVLSMTIGVYLMNGVLSEGDVARINLVLKDSMGRLTREDADAQTPATPDAGEL